MTCAEATEAMSAVEMADLIRHAPPGPWPAGWAGWANVHEAVATLLGEYAARPHGYPTDRFQPGRCIVSCVSAKPGHSSGKDLANGYLPAAWVLANELRHHGCTLPIYFCHLGPLEWSPKLTALVASLGVEVINLRDRERADPCRILGGWESKVYAAEHVPFEHIMFLDADNVPVRDPTFLFDDPDYQRLGAIFWPDLPPINRPEWLPPAAWAAAGLDHRKEVDFESGQFVINKARCWRELRVTRWINEHSDRFYEVVFGDKSTFHLGWRKCGTDYAMPKKAAGWNGGAILQSGPDGRPLFEHCVQNKPTLRGYPKETDGRPRCLTNGDRCKAHLKQLATQWNGRLWDGAVGADRAAAQDIIGRTFLYRRIGLGERLLRFLEDDRIGLGGARCEFSWGVSSGRLVVSDVDGKPTMVLDRRSDGAWVGQWLEFERANVELIPVGGA